MKRSIATITFLFVALPLLGLLLLSDLERQAIAQFLLNFREPRHAVETKPEIAESGDDLVGALSRAEAGSPFETIRNLHVLGAHYEQSGQLEKARIVYLELHLFASKSTDDSAQHGVDSQRIRGLEPTPGAQKSPSGFDVNSDEESYSKI